MRSEFANAEELAGVQYCLYDWRDNLILELSRTTGLRVGDCLALRPSQLVPRPYIVEEKTGKKRRIYIRKGLLDELRRISGKVWVFEGASPLRHRSYDALYKDVRQAAASYAGPRSGAHISPHSWRKAYAVAKYHESGGNLSKVRRLLGHDSELVTMLYAFSDRFYGESRSNKSN